MSLEYSVISSKELFENKDNEQLADEFWKQVQAYEKEIGGSDMGPGGFLQGEPNIFMIREEGRIVGWIIGNKPLLTRLHRKEKGFVPTAVYVEPSMRRRVNLRTVTNKLVEILKREGFHSLSLTPEFGGQITKTGEKFLDKVFHRSLKQRGLKENEGYVQNKLILDREGLLTIFDLEEIARRRHESRGLLARKKAWLTRKTPRRVRRLLKPVIKLLKKKK